MLVVDDSLTVRELERKLLGNRGYDVEVAVDGMDGWNAVRTGHFDLVVTDIDMPRMDGIELVALIKQGSELCKSLPVMIVSYKDRDEDRRRGLDAGAEYYLTKGSFHDETLLQAVIDLIGEARMRIGIVNERADAVARAAARCSSSTGARRGLDGGQRRRSRRTAAAQDRPDLVLMDLLVPGLDGVEATRRIMAATPCAILIVTDSVRANAARVFDAMGGARSMPSTSRG